MKSAGWVAAFVNGVLLAAIIATWIWTWWWNRRAANLEAEAIRYVLTVVRNNPPWEMSRYEQSVWRHGLDDAMDAYLTAATGKEKQ